MHVVMRNSLMDLVSQEQTQQNQTSEVNLSLESDPPLAFTKPKREFCLADLISEAFLSNHRRTLPFAASSVPQSSDEAGEEEDEITHYLRAAATGFEVFYPRGVSQPTSASQVGGQRMTGQDSHRVVFNESSTSKLNETLDQP